MLDKKRIGIFGGSFDPPHKGHKRVVEICLKSLFLDEVLVIPAYQTPNKIRPSADPLPRLEMTKKLFKNLSPAVRVLDIEISKKETRYTIDTVKELSSAGDLFLIIGSDLFSSFSGWKDFQSLIKKAHLAVVNRGGVKIQKIKGCNEFLKQYTKQEFQPHSALKKAHKIQITPLKTGKNIYFLNMDAFSEITSTKMREKLSAGQSVFKDSPPELLNLIKKNYALKRKTKLKENLIKDALIFLNSKGALNSQVFEFQHSVYDAIIVSSGLNTRHVRALSGSLREFIKTKYGWTPQYAEGEDLCQWVVFDYGALLVHVFYEYLREYYQLENLWSAQAAGRRK